MRDTTLAIKTAVINYTTILIAVAFSWKYRKEIKHSKSAFIIENFCAMDKNGSQHLYNTFDIGDVNVLFG